MTMTVTVILSNIPAPSGRVASLLVLLWASFWYEPSFLLQRKQILTPMVQVGLDMVRKDSLFPLSLASCLRFLLFSSLQTIIATAIPRITDDFKGINLVGWYASAFFIALACFQPFW